MAQTNRSYYNNNNQNQHRNRTSSPYYSAKIDSLVNGDGNIKAYATVTVGNAVAIHNLRVMDSRKGLFVSMPSRSFTDKNGDTKYTDIAHAVTKEAREAINSCVLSAYHQMTQGQNSDFTEMDDIEDLPFDEDEAGSYGFAQVM